jgi:hypothetical protein
MNPRRRTNRLFQIETLEYRVVLSHGNPTSALVGSVAAEDHQHGGDDVTQLAPGADDATPETPGADDLSRPTTPGADDTTPETPGADDASHASTASASQSATQEHQASKGVNVIRLAPSVHDHTNVIVHGARHPGHHSRLHR